MYVCMYVWIPRACMYACLKPTSVYVCMYVWSHQACMFEVLKRVCLKPSSVYECMSNFTKKFGVQKPFGKRSPGAFLFTFLVLCEGGYFGEALKHVCMHVWIAQACMYACMFEFLDRVCMFEFLDRVCMYVWSPQACMFEGLKRVCWSVYVWACMYVCLKHTYINQTYIHS